MFSSLLLICLLPILALGTSGPVDFHPEEPCNRVGGQCIKRDECSVHIEDQYLNLCPQQQSQGAECCHGVSTKEHRCRRFGGECFREGTRCPDGLKRPEATDCPTGQFCCIVIH
ncbi:hypothetical protein RI129_010736 [Pyrocoelia pectoralis]|uniref:Uncharacterized protein n=1 Tax=Pyrocoelia pectoralis TaxID=417401 RepID=A0AAN7UZD1_9COLE